LTQFSFIYSTKLSIFQLKLFSTKKVKLTLKIVDPTTYFK